MRNAAVYYPEVGEAEESCTGLLALGDQEEWQLLGLGQEQFAFASNRGMCSGICT